MPLLSAKEQNLGTLCPSSTNFLHFSSTMALIPKLMSNSYFLQSTNPKVRMANTFVTITAWRIFAILKIQTLNLWSYCCFHHQVDTGCLNSYAIQLQGTKLWLLWPPPESEFTSSRQKRDLKPVGVILEPGDLLVFYPGWLHETHVIHHPSLSMSIYWDHAIAKFRPTEFYENHADDILRAYPDEYCSCANEWRLSSDHGGTQVCWYNKLQTIYSYAVVCFIMASTVAFVLILAVMVNIFLKKNCPQSDDRNRDD